MGHNFLLLPRQRCSFLCSSTVVSKRPLEVGQNTDPSRPGRKEGRKEGPKGNWEKEEGARCSSHLSFLPSRRLTLTTNQRQGEGQCSEHCSVHSRTSLKPSFGNVCVNNQDGLHQVEKARLCLKRQPEHRVAQPRANQFYHHFKNTKDTNLCELHEKSVFCASVNAEIEGYRFR